MDIHITRKGEKFGPYPEAVARQYLEDGTLAATDLAWHSGADGWKPLGEVLGIATQASPEPQPPPEPTPAASPPATPATSGPPPATPAGDSETAAGDADEIFITRKGQQIGPAPRAKAMELFTAGKLVPTDWGWHDGMDEWKPLYEVLGMEVPAQPAFAPAAAAGKPGKGKKIALIVGIVVLVAGLAAAGYFFLYPMLEGDSEAKAPAVGLPEAAVGGDGGKGTPEGSGGGALGSDVGESSNLLAKSSLALILLGVGFLMSLAGWIWFLVVAFQESIAWGIGCLLCCFVWIAFLFMHWDAAKKPFLVSLGGGVFYVLAGVVAGGGSGSSY